MKMKEFKELQAKVAAENVLANKLQSSEKIQAIKESLKTDGMLNPIILTADNQILDGAIRCTLLLELYASSEIDDNYEVKVGYENGSTETQLLLKNLLNKDISKLAKAAIAYKYFYPAEKQAAEERKKGGVSCQEKGTALDLAAAKAGTNREYINNIAKIEPEYFEDFYDLILQSKVKYNELKTFTSFSKSEKATCVNKFLKNNKTLANAIFAILKNRETETQVSTDTANQEQEQEQDFNKLTSGYTNILLHKVKEKVEDEKIFIVAKKSLAENAREAIAHILCTNNYNSEALYLKFGSDVFKLNAATKANYTEIIEIEESESEEDENIK